MKILIHVHLYYHEQINYILKKLANIVGVESTLYVTMTKDNKEIRDKILRFYKDAKIILVDNIGYDIYPFCEVLRRVNLKDYDYILKIHTKAPRKLFYFNILKRYFAYFGWRNLLISALIGSKNKFKQNIKILNKDNEYGAVGYESFLLSSQHEDEHNKLRTTEIVKKWDLPLKNTFFIAGTMFLCKAESMTKFQQMNFTKDDFETKTEQQTGNVGELAHSLETVLGVVVYDNKQKIYPQKACFIDELENFIRVQKYLLLKNIFSIRNSDDKKHKVIILLGLKFKFKYKNNISKRTEGNEANEL